MTSAGRLRIIFVSDLIPVKLTVDAPRSTDAVAIARELAAYCWEIATCPTTSPEPTPTPTTRKTLSNSR